MNHPFAQKRCDQPTHYYGSPPLEKAIKISVVELD